MINFNSIKANSIEERTGINSITSISLDNNSNLDNHRNSYDSCNNKNNINSNHNNRNNCYNTNSTFLSFMEIAIQEALEASARNSVPVGAIIVRKNEIISKAGNEVIKNIDPTAHAEILAIRRASSFLRTEFLSECDIFVTLEPCAMCAQAISLARIKRLYFGAYDEKNGAVIHGCRVFEHSLHKVEAIGGVFESHCSNILKNFFKLKRS